MDEFALFKIHKNYDFKSFDCGDEDLNQFFFHSAINYQEQYLATTHVLENLNEPIAYFSLLNDSLNVQNEFYSNNSLKKFLRSILPHGKRHLQNYPALKIGRLAVSKNKQGNNWGTKLIDLIIDFALTQNQKSACRFIIVDAYKDSIPFYQKNRFEFLSVKDQNTDTRQMYLDLTPLNQIP